MSETRERPAILVTGGAGYIGAHACKALDAAGYLPVTYDNLSAGYREAVLWGPLVEGDVRDTAALAAAMAEHRVQAVIHFAGLIEVGRSSVDPAPFWDINVNGVAAVLAAMRQTGVERIIFSSTAAVYGQPADALAAIPEDAPPLPINPYGETKLAAERMIAAACRAYGLTGVALRYFNASGADPDGRIGEAHNPETHLIPLTVEAALGLGKALTVFGRDFDTPDGACVRDYIHVDDLADAHVKALTLPRPEHGFAAMNLGLGQGHSVLQVIEAVNRATNGHTPYSIGDRRLGDPAVLVADPGQARQRLGWAPRHERLDEIVATAVRWRKDPRYGDFSRG